MLVHVGLTRDRDGRGTRRSTVARRSARSVGLIAAPALVVILMSAQMRTQSLAYPLFVAAAWLLIADARAPSRRVLLVLPILVLWANVHGSVVLGAVLTTAWGVLLIARAMRQKDGSSKELLVRGSLLAVVPVSASSPHRTARRSSTTTAARRSIRPLPASSANGSTRGRRS